MTTRPRAAPGQDPVAGKCWEVLGCGSKTRTRPTRRNWIRSATTTAAACGCSTCDPKHGGRIRNQEGGHPRRPARLGNGSLGRHQLHPESDEPDHRDRTAEVLRHSRTGSPVRNDRRTASRRSKLGRGRERHAPRIRFHRQSAARRRRTRGWHWESATTPPWSASRTRMAVSSPSTC